MCFIQAVQDPTLLDECGLDEKTKTTLLENIQQKLTQQAVKIRADIEVSCYTYEGERRFHPHPWSDNQCSQIRFFVAL